MIDYYATCVKFIDQCGLLYDYPVIIGEDIEHTLWENLIGTNGTIRLGSKPSDETKREILKRIHEKVKRRQALEVSSAWGAIKTIPNEYRGPDIAELLTLKQYDAIAKRIKKIYPPGIHFNIYLNDSYYYYLYGFDPQVDEYCQGMENLSNDYAEIEVVRLSSICKNKVLIDQQCEKNFEYLHRYWVESDILSLESHDALLSFIDLKSIGWVGKITPAMRSFYLKRMSILYPHESFDFWVQKILRFFAYGLLISQNDYMGRKSPERSTVDACLLRVPPPDLPRKLYSNRLRFSIAPKSIIKSSAPPWTVAGIIKINNMVPKIHLLNGMDYQKEKLQQFRYDKIMFGVSELF